MDTFFKSKLTFQEREAPGPLIPSLVACSFRDVFKACGLCQAQAIQQEDQVPVFRQLVG